MRATLCSAPLMSSPEKQLAGRLGAHISARDAQAETWFMKEDGMNTMALVHTNDSVGGKSDVQKPCRGAAGLQIPGVATIARGENGPVSAHGPAALTVDGKLHASECFQGLSGPFGP